jgi:hypothetical protein
MRRLPPEEKVRITIELTDAATCITAAGIKDSDPDITEEQLLEELRKRVAPTRRTRDEGRPWTPSGG